MKNVVHKSRNYRLILDLFNRIRTPVTSTGRYGLGIIMGEPGLGKSMGLDMLQAEVDHPIVITPCETLMSNNSFLREILVNLKIAEERQRSSSVLISKITRHINLTRGFRPILIFDECQYLRYGNREIWETIKAISNRLSSPIICAGRPEGFELFRETRFNDFGWRKYGFEIELEPIIPEDLIALLGDLAECEYSVPAKKILFERSGRNYGKLVTDLSMIEKQAKRAKITTVEPEHIRKWGAV